MSIMAELVEFLEAHLGRSRDTVAQAQAAFDAAKVALEEAQAAHAIVVQTVATAKPADPGQTPA